MLSPQPGRNRNRGRGATGVQIAGIMPRTTKRAKWEHITVDATPHSRMSYVDERLKAAKEFAGTEGLNFVPVLKNIKLEIPEDGNKTPLHSDF